MRMRMEEVVKTWQRGEAIGLSTTVVNYVHQALIKLAWERKLSKPKTRRYSRRIRKINVKSQKDVMGFYIGQERFVDEVRRNGFWTSLGGITKFLVVTPIAK